MSPQSLGSPVISAAALRSVNFFNGRLLTGGDLSQEQSTVGARLQQLAQTSGEGVAFGLEVQETVGSSTPQNPIVTVNAGLALSRSGLALSLPSSVDVSLATSAPTDTSEDGGLFAPCQPFAPGTYTAGAGVYLLWIGPASQGEGLAAVNGLGNQTAPCNVDEYINTVQFGLIRIALTPDQLADSQHLRSLIASMCFAPQVLAALTADPFAPAATYGLIDELRAQLLTDDQVPLAIFGWDVDNGIAFVDLWSVRRRVIRPPAEDDFVPFAGDRRRAEGEAMFLQFQAHIGQLIAAGSPEQLVLSQHFQWLPPVGVLPLSGQGPGVDIGPFFGGVLTRGPTVLEGARLEPLIGQALSYAPIDPASGNVIWLYQVRENLLSAQSLFAPEGLYLVFASGFLPYAANAQYTLAYWDYANYSLHAN